MREHRGKPFRDVEAVEEPAPPRFLLTMRRRMALMGLVYFLAAVVLLSTTYPEMIDAYKRMQGTDVTEPSAKGNATDETEPGQDTKGTNDTAPPVGDALLLFENFHPYYADWYVRQLPAEKSQMAIHYHEGLVLGYLYLNVTEDWSSEDAHWIEMVTYDEFSPPVGLQVKLMCSDDNGLQSDRGGGHRSWGFGERGPRFESFSPDSDEPLQGFWATSGKEDSVNREPIEGIDVTQWHDYTILWDLGRAIFLVDGVVVAEIEEAPNDPMAAVCFLNNCHYHTDTAEAGYWELDSGFLDLDLGESIAIDYLCVAELGLWNQDEGFGRTIEEMYD